jgi:hypothetical protein
MNIDTANDPDESLDTLVTNALQNLEENILALELAASSCSDDSEIDALASRLTPKNLSAYDLQRLQDELKKARFGDIFTPRRSGKTSPPSPFNMGSTQSEDDDSCTDEFANSDTLYAIEDCDGGIVGHFHSEVLETRDDTSTENICSIDVKASQGKMDRAEHPKTNGDEDQSENMDQVKRSSHATDKALQEQETLNEPEKVQAKPFRIRLRDIAKWALLWIQRQVKDFVSSFSPKDKMISDETTA